LTLERPIFINRLKRICNYPHRLLVITATLSQVSFVQSGLLPG
jgi:hypothetical protein